MKRIPRKRNYDEEAKKFRLEASPTENHPLKAVIEIQTQPSLSSSLSLSTSKEVRKSSIKSYSDPLSELVNQDPLSKMVADVTLKEKVMSVLIFLMIVRLKI